MAVGPRNRTRILGTRSMLLDATVPASMANGGSLAIIKRPGLAPCAPRADTNLDWSRATMRRTLNVGATIIGANRETTPLGDSLGGRGVSTLLQPRRVVPPHDAPMPGVVVGSGL